MQYLYLFGGIACEVVATSALKATNGFTRPGATLVTLLGYALALYLISIPARSLPLGVVYAIWSGTGITLITLAGWVFYGDRLSAAMAAGIVLTTSGILVLSLANATSDS